LFYVDVKLGIDLNKTFQLSNSSTFYEQLLRQYSLAKKVQSQTAIRVKLHKAFLYKKGWSKMLMKLISSCHIPLTHFRKAYIGCYQQGKLF